MIGSAVGSIVVVVIIITVTIHTFLGFLRMLLHMLRQIGLLGVGLATKVTNMRLEMFGLLVLGDVVQEGGFVGEALVAGVTLVRFVRLMTTGMGLKVGELREGLITSWMTTFVRLVTRVRSYMLLQMRQLRKLSLANLTPVRLDPCRNKQKKKHILKYTPEKFTFSPTHTHSSPQTLFLFILSFP